MGSTSNCISYRFADCLKALKVSATALRESFPVDIEDRILFDKLRGRDIVFVAADLKQLSRQHEAHALKRIGCTAIYFGPFWQKMTFWEQAAWIVRQWPKIDGFVSAAEQGTIAEIKQNGRAMIFAV